MIELTINGKKVAAEPKTTVLQAATQNGIYIPHLCWDKRLAAYGGCRLCLVEVEGQRKLLAACSTPVEKDMVVHTETPKLHKARGTVLELLLVHHPLDCPTCDQAGECELQELVHKYGRPEGRFVRQRKSTPPDIRGPLIELNSNRCILCGKCVRVCHEYQGVGALGLIGRGFPTTVKPAFGETLECEYCGQCMDVCPTGALLSKPYKFKARPWFLEEKETICPFCGSGCTLTLGIRDGIILRSKGKDGSGVSGGNLCSRGRFGFDFIYSEDRLKTPLLRRNGKLEPATWDEAFSYIAGALKSIAEAHGAASIGAVGSPKCTNEDNRMLAEFMRTVIGTNNLDSSAYFGHGKVQDAFMKGFGVPAPPISLESPLEKEIILAVESDPSVTHPVFGLSMLRAKRNGSKLFVADSKKTKLARHAGLWLRIKPGTSAAFLNGIMKVLVEESLIDREPVKDIAGFSGLEAALKDYSVEKACAATGLSGEEIKVVARELAKAKSRLLTMSLGVTDNTKGTGALFSAINLLLLLGEKPGTLQIPAEYCNTYGLYESGLRPRGDGKGLADMLYKPGTLRALYVMGEDPLVSFPDTSKIAASLNALELLVVQDISLTATAKVADVVLPASSWAEKEGTFTNAGGIRQRFRQVVSAPGGARADWEILRDLSGAMGKKIGLESPDTAGAGTSGMPAASKNGGASSPAFVPALYSPGEEPGEEFPLMLITRDLPQHSGNLSSNSKSLNLVASDAFLEISEADALKIGVSANSHIKIVSRRGSVYMKGKVSDSVPEGVVAAPPHFPHSKINLLTHLPSDGEAPVDTVRVEPIGLY